MKNLIVIGLFFFSIPGIYVQCDDFQGDMSDVQSYADDAYSYAEKACYADNLKDAQYYAKKAKNSADDCESEASSGQFECD